ncbi:hypothetical protein E2C01_091968 [Portunus trituberculatus]|uniref:Uncharacterized protein n=1 Tax=Portunus trituberculatus TaxID=210409 RepID=A0A5B7JQH6_PORTR|nr:hypothetical protein [Portunus trituberculatus]
MKQGGRQYYIYTTMHPYSYTDPLRYKPPSYKPPVVGDNTQFLPICAGDSIPHKGRLSDSRL